MPDIQLDNVLDTLIDYRGKTPKKTNSGIRLITAKVIKKGTITNTSYEYIAEDDYDLVMRRGLPKKGDILITTEAPLGEVAEIKTDEKIALAQRVILLRANPQVMEPKFLLYALQSNKVQADLYARASGTTVLGIKQPELRKVLIPYPELSVQRKIASILSAYDDLIDNNNRRIAILEEMARRLYREWFVHFRFPGHEKVKMVESELGLIPEGWEVKHFGELVDYRRNSIPKGMLPEAMPYMGLEHMPRRSIALSTWDMETEIGSTKLKFQVGDILFGKIRPYFHKVGVAQVDGVCSSDTFVLRPKQNYHALTTCIASSDDFVAHSVQTSQGTKMPRANWDVLKDYRLPFATNNLLFAFEKSVNPIIEMIGKLSAKNRNLRQQRDMLLPNLISGRR